MALETLQVADGVHRRAAQALNEATVAATEADRAARSAEAVLARCREAAVRAEGLAQQANHAWGSLAERILERLGANPVCPIRRLNYRGDRKKARGRLDRLTKERDEMGPVNLRAETEAEAIEQQIAMIDKEREELTTAIARLRGSIGNLNREGRERFDASVPGGGWAFPAVVHADVRRRAGASGAGRFRRSAAGRAGNYAQPPGKKLAALSLLSGGEQALTALSLIFAVFRCNPAPICVLDEVDAPLDDANVERFCMLLEDIERRRRRGSLSLRIIR